MFGEKKIKCQQSLVLIKHPVQTDSSLDAAAARELAVTENEQKKIKQTPMLSCMSDFKNDSLNLLLTNSQLHTCTLAQLEICRRVAQSIDITAREN